MIDFESRLSKMETEVAAMKEKVSFFSVIYEKFDKTLEKLDQRTIEDKKEIQAMMDELRTDLVQEMKLMRHEAQQKKIEDLNTWRWFVVGGAAVVGWLASKLISFELK